MSLPTIDLDELQQVVDHDLAYGAVRTALDAIAADAIDMPNESALKLRDGGEIHIKGGRLISQPYIVFKVAAGGFASEGNAGCSILLDAETGAPAILLNDRGWLTEMRTAASGAVAADLLAVDGDLNVAILGTGIQARYQLEALKVRRNLTSVRVWGRSSAKTRALADEVGAVACASIEDAVVDADLVVTTTSATEPILLGHHLRPGMHITAMGSDMAGKRELAAEVLAQADIIAGDDPSHCALVGELQHAPEHLERTVGLALLSANTSTMRRSRADISVADLCGLGAYDAAIACAALAQLQARGLIA